MRKACAAFLFMSIVSAACGGQQAEPVNEYVFEEGFSIKVPADWVQIPEEVLDEHSRMVARTMPNTKVDPFVAGFQHSAGAVWLVPPLVVVQVNTGGRLPEERLRDMSQFNRGFQAGARDAFSNVEMDNVTGEFGKAQYDEKHGLLISVNDMEAQGGLAVRQLLVMKLTNAGAIVLSFGTMREDFDEWRPVFDAIAVSIKLDPALDYNNVQAAPTTPRGPRVTDTFEYRLGYYMGTVAAVLLLLLGIVAIMKRLLGKWGGRPFGPPPGPPPARPDS